MQEGFRTLLALACIWLTGCGTTSGFLRDASTVNQHQYRQDVKTVTYLRSVHGSSTIGSFFCIMPVSGGVGLYKDAMVQLHRMAALQPNQVLENIREDHESTAYLVFFCTKTLTLSADVVELTPADEAHAAPQAAPSPPPRRAPAPEPVSSGLLPSTCEAAYSQMGQLIVPLRQMYPLSVFTFKERPPPQSTFVAICEEQPESVQTCLDSSHMKSHVSECKEAFAQLSPKSLRRLLLTFLKDYE